MLKPSKINKAYIMITRRKPNGYTGMLNQETHATDAECGLTK
jgi:hypothetical protein